MSGGYAARLSPFPNKGETGLPELVDLPSVLDAKIESLYNLLTFGKLRPPNVSHLLRLKSARRPKVVLLTGAGISTAAGIPDFRGPNGIWTKEKLASGASADDPSAADAERGSKKARMSKKQLPSSDDCDEPAADFSFVIPSSISRASSSGAYPPLLPPSPLPPPMPSSPSSSIAGLPPTYTHYAIAALAAAGVVDHVVTQNVDGLHLRSGLPRSQLSILHGDCFIEKCISCKVEYVRDYDVKGMGCRPTGRLCDDGECGGELHDTTLDWEDELPEPDKSDAYRMCEEADVCLALGTSLRITPAGLLPLKARSFVVINLQETMHDKKAILVIRAKVDDVMRRIMDMMQIDVQEGGKRIAI